MSQRAVLEARDEGLLSSERFLHPSKGSSLETALLGNAREKFFLLLPFSGNILGVFSPN